VSRAATLLLGLAMVGCAPVEVPPGLAGAHIERAWLEEYNWNTMGVLGGGLTGHAWLYAVDSQGGYHEQYVRLRGGLAGFGFEFTLGGDRFVELDLPPGDVTGAQLFDRYSGSFEAFVVGFGFASLHLKNEHGVELDDHGFVGPLMAVSISAAWMRLVPAEPPPEPDSAEPGDTGSGHPPDDTGETGDSDPSGETGDSDPPAETGDTAGGTGIADG
jgi:hypothetical protein